MRPHAGVCVFYVLAAIEQKTYFATLSLLKSVKGVVDGCRRVPARTLLQPHAPPHAPWLLHVRWLLRLFQTHQSLLCMPSCQRQLPPYASQRHTLLPPQLQAIAWRLLQELCFMITTLSMASQLTRVYCWCGSLAKSGAYQQVILSNSNSRSHGPQLQTQQAGQPLVLRQSCNKTANRLQQYPAACC